MGNGQTSALGEIGGGRAGRAVGESGGATTSSWGGIIVKSGLSISLTATQMHCLMCTAPHDVIYMYNRIPNNATLILTYAVSA